MMEQPPGPREWVQCNSEACSKWMHEDCTGRDEEGHLVYVCGAIFV